MKLFLFILVISCILSLVSAQCNCNENLPNVPNCELLPQCGKRISRKQDSCSKLETNKTLIDECNKTHFSNNLKNKMGCPDGTKAWPLLHIWYITYEDATPGGVERPVYKINGGFPGPTIQAIKGDWILVPVINNITGHEPNLTTIHWHGVTMRGKERQTEWTSTENPGTPFMDGVPGVNQCAIPNQGRFDYFFQFVDSGTFWYHSHFGAQLADGLSGAMVVKDCEDVNRVKNLNDDNLTYNEVDDWNGSIITVTDWFSSSTAENEFNKYKYNAKTSDIKLLNASSPFVRFLIPNEPIPDAGLINGKGDGKFTIRFVQGKTYRLRLINVSAMSLFTFSIQNHSFEVIEVEGMLVKRNNTARNRKFEELPINAGQRYSILVTADQKKGIYGMRFFSDCQRDVNNHVDIKGIIRYDDPVVDQPKFGEPPYNYDCTDLPKDALIPYCDKTYTLFCKRPPQNDSFYEMKIIIDTTQTGKNISDGQNVYGVLSEFSDQYYLDHDWSSAKNNTLLGVYDNTIGSYTKTKTRNIITDLPELSTPKSVIDIFFNNLDPLEHPIHLHGHFFYVLGFGFHFAGDDIDYSLNEINPIQRDTVTVPPRGWAQIRFVVDNPGVWPMHCHVDWHLGIGMLAQFVELNATKIKSRPPKDWCEICQLPTDTVCNEKSNG